MNMKHKAVTVLLVVIGSLQMAGDVLGLDQLKGFGLATHASPAPKVFTAHEGFETFSSRFYIQWFDRKGISHRMEMTPSQYSGIRGPYNRRNAYGAALSYGPVLTKNSSTVEMFNAVAEFTFCSDSSFVTEIGMTEIDSRRPVTLVLEPRGHAIENADWQLDFVIRCEDDQKIAYAQEVE